MSPWRYLLAPKVDQALITMTGFDGASFASLLQKFAPLFDDHTPFNTSHIFLKQDPSKGGRPRNGRSRATLDATGRRHIASIRPVSPRGTPWTLILEQKAELWRCEIAVPAMLAFKRHKMDPLLTSSKQQAA